MMIFLQNQHRSLHLFNKDTLVDKQSVSSRHVRIVECSLSLDAQGWVGVDIGRTRRFVSLQGVQRLGF